MIPVPFTPFAGCQSGGPPLTRFEGSPIIDSLLVSAAHFVVNTEIEAEKWVASTRLGFETISLILGRPNRIIAIRDSVYVSNCQSVAIFAVEKETSPRQTRRDITRH